MGKSIKAYAESRTNTLITNNGLILCGPAI